MSNQPENSTPSVSSSAAAQPIANALAKPLVLCILDGWGVRNDPEDNAIALANTPTWDRWWAAYPRAQLEASENFVGLPMGQMGNSEVGHMNIGAGRVILQDLPRIDSAIADGSLAASDSMASFIANLRQTGGRAHVIGLLSPGGVHAHEEHIGGLAAILDKAGIPALIHAISDGRDMPPASGLASITAFCNRHPYAHIATLSGRYYAMDRDNRWDRVERAYRVIAEGKQATHHPYFASVTAAIEAAYADGKTDEFILPAVIGSYDGIRPGDGLIMANFRADRAREIMAALVKPDFAAFTRSPQPAWASCLAMVDYASELSPYYQVAFPAEKIEESLGAVIAGRGLKQLRIAETEKYAHVTFFFNGGEETVFPGEERILIPSPDVATYDLKPEMSAEALTDQLCAAISNGQHDLIIVNYANTDMVGHTGNITAAIKAVETVDHCLARLEDTLAKGQGMMLVTADHGNADMMRDPVTGEAHTAHTMNPVPFVLVAPAYQASKGGTSAIRIDNGRLADIAPSLLHLLQIPQPTVMTGQNLIHGLDK